MQIFIKLLSGKTITVDVAPSDKIVAVKKKISSMDGTPIEQQRLVYTGNPLDDEKTLEECHIEKESTVYLIMNPSAAKSKILSSSGSKMSGMVTEKKQIQINVRAGASAMPITIDEDAPLGELKKIIAGKTAMSAESQLIYQGQVKLADGKSLKDQGIQNGALLTIVTFVKGGE